MFEQLQFWAILVFAVSATTSLLLQAIRLSFFKKHKESITTFLCYVGLLGALLGIVLLAVGFFVNGPAVMDLGNWFGAGDVHFKILLALDSVSITYGFFSMALLLLIAFFSERYIHREVGFHRFYFLLNVFGLALCIVAFAGSLEVLVVGWELVGLTSVLLIAFFTHRPKPAKNALGAFVIYRLCDVGLIAATFLALSYHSADFLIKEGGHFAVITYSSGGAVLLGCLIVFASMGKAAQFPLSGWLPRAMEGPSPSSAVFYGALSVHLGPLLLLRAEAIIADDTALMWLVLCVGALSAFIGQLIAKMQTDIKSRLAYGSITQVGVITMEIALGLHILALVHIMTHAVVRTLQILRAPSLLHERHHLESMLGHPLRVYQPSDKPISFFHAWLYRFGLERAGVDTLLRDKVWRPIQRTIEYMDLLDATLADRLSFDHMKKIPQKSLNEKVYS